MPSGVRMSAGQSWKGVSLLDLDSAVDVDHPPTTDLPFAECLVEMVDPVPDRVGERWCC